jgi:histone deacetylase 11
MALLAYISNNVRRPNKPAVPAKYPVVFSRHYDISFLGIENIHPFDSKKYGKVFTTLSKHFKFKLKDCHQPTKPVSDKDLLKVHTKEYIDSLDSWLLFYIATCITEVPLLLPNFLIRKALLKPMKLATEGTISAVYLAFKYGWAVNLSGGYHHAQPDNGGGFCFFADIPLAIQIMREKEQYKDTKVLIVDLDAHHGDGHAVCCEDDPNTYIFDMYNGQTYPVTPYDRTSHLITYKYPLSHHTTTESYRAVLQDNLASVIDTVNPGLIIYNAGTDIYEKDPIGRLSVSEEGIIERDKYVFDCAEKCKIPILMTLSGGYTKESAGIISKSLINIIKQKNILNS